MKQVVAFKAETVVFNGFILLAKEVEWRLKLTVNQGYTGYNM